ncbi:MAG TPA: N-acetylglucosamine-6-phosphate deacetylase [Xanthobacteraceae bacterium]|nr:N-acetylglucosamine-6-phosphate deacetylase [Xanthobacteraceae bacterium]
MSLARHAIAASHVFDGSAVHRDCAVVIDGNRITALVPRGDVPAGVPVAALPEGLWLAPGFIDTQVNGGGGMLFNNAPTPETIATILRAHRRFGTTALLPTLITDVPETTASAIRAVDEAAASMPGVIGIHLEGPFLSPDRPGVHDPRRLRWPDNDDLAMITAKRRGVTLVTLAPEQVPAGFVSALTSAGVRVALGHSMATYAQTRAAIVDGLTGFTHLFNAMRPLASREPGPIAAALENPAAWFGMIVDGVHVDPAVLRLALRGLAQPMLVTDAMPPVGANGSAFTLYGDEITVRDGRCLRRDGTLAGSALDMASAVRNCVDLLGVPLTDALRFASSNPANFLGLGHSIGRLAPDYRADLVAFDPTSIEVVSTWVAGASAD